MAKKKKQEIYNFEKFDRKKAREAIENTLIKRHGELCEEWYIPINELLDTLELKALCMDNIRQNGIVTKEGKRNEFISAVSSLESNAFKMMCEMGMGLKSSNRVKELKRRGGKTQDADLLTALIGADDEDDED